MALTDDQLRAIGQITVLFGRLEFSASLLLLVLVNPTNQDIGRVAFEDARFGRVLDTIGKVCPYALKRKPELQQRVRDWIPKAKSAAQQRNSVLHSFWVHDQSSGEMIVSTRIGTTKPPIRATDLDQLTNDVVSALREVDQMLIELLPRAN